MLHEERHNRILKEISDKGAVKVAQLAQLLGTSESTIRRDINELDSAGLLKKVFGGAISLDRKIKTVEEDIAEKVNLKVEEKALIAKYAASMLQDNDFVFIDAGTTTEMMIDYIENDTVTFVTNGINHGHKLVQKGFNVYMPAGKLKKSTLSIVGAEAVAFLNKCNFTKCFMGANGVDLRRGFTTPTMEGALLKEEAMKRSQEVYVLADSGKFGRISVAGFGKLEDACIITDKLIDEKYKKFTVIKEVKQEE